MIVSRTAGSAEEKADVVAKTQAQGFKSDFVGVSWDKQGQQWRVQVNRNGKTHSLTAWVSFSV